MINPIQQNVYFKGNNGVNSSSAAKVPEDQKSVRTAYLDNVDNVAAIKRDMSNKAEAALAKQGLDITA